MKKSVGLCKFLGLPPTDSAIEVLEIGDQGRDDGHAECSWEDKRMGAEFGDHYVILHREPDLTAVGTDWVTEERRQGSHALNCR